MTKTTSLTIAVLFTAISVYFILFEPQRPFRPQSPRSITEAPLSQATTVKTVITKAETVRPTKSQSKAVRSATEKPKTASIDFSLLLKHIASGGIPKDGIPAIDKPEYTNAAVADKWLLPHDVVFGVADKSFIAAYPQRILVFHEIVNENISGERISITYCPLTGTAIGYKGKTTTFGVSGKLINSNLVMYDRATGSYWPQILGVAIKGPNQGNQLKEFPVLWTTWEKWKKKYPQTKVLSRKTGFIRDYSQDGDPYGSYLSQNKGYYEAEGVFFELMSEDKRLSAKTVVVGVRDMQGNAAAILKEHLRAKKKVELKLGKQTVTLSYDQNLDTQTASIKETGEWLNSFDAMWFAWAAFYPQTKLVR